MVYIGDCQEIEQVSPLKIGVVAETMEKSHSYLNEIDSQEGVLFRIGSRWVCRNCEYVQILKNESRRNLALDQLIIVDNGEWCSQKLFNSVLKPLIKTKIPPEYKHLWVQFAEI